MTKQISLTQGKVAIVDDEDFEWLNQWKWCARKDGPRWYVMRRNCERELVQMHRFILNPQAHLETDHRNGNGLDNRRCNLRSCTRSQNSMNSKKRTGCTSQFKGICWRQDTRKWRARIQFNDKRHNLGCFDNELKAAKAYNKAASRLFGEFARLNVIGEQV